MSSPASTTEVAAIQARLRDLEAETSGLVRRLRAAPQAELAGAHLVLEARGREVLLSAASVDEVVRVVALQAMAGAAPAIAGAFLCRGRWLFALELGAVLEGRAASAVPIDAHLVVLNSALPLALLVDRVKEVVSGVTLIADERRGSAPEVAVERRAPQLGKLVAKVGKRVMPLLEPAQFSSLVPERAP